MNSAPSLHDLQHWLKWIITDPRGVSSALKNPRPNFEAYNERYTEPASSQIQWIERGTVSAVDRLDVYAEGYFSRVVECLAKDFPKTQLAVGERCFSVLVSQYLKAHPSQVSSIDEIGSQFAAFISSWPNLPFAWISDLANLEWQQIEAFYAIEPPPTPNWHSELNLSSLEGLRFQIHPSVSFVASNWNLPKIIESLSLRHSSHKQENFSSPSYLIIYRHQDFYHWDAVSRPIFDVLKNLKSGLNLAEATEHLSEESAPALSRAFSDWVEKSILCGII